MATLSAPTIDDLIQDVRTMLGQPNSTNSTWTDEELTTYLNQGVRRYFTEVVQNMEGAFTTTTTLDCVSGVETIALPADFFKIKNLYVKVTQGYAILNYRNSLNRSYTTTGDTSAENFRPDYFLRGTDLVFHPVPNFTSTGGAYLLEYVQFPETMISGGDSLTTQVSPVFKDLIEMYAVYKAKLRESMTSGTDTASGALSNLNDLFTSFKEIVTSVSANPTYVQPWNPEDY